MKCKILEFWNAINTDKYSYTLTEQVKKLLSRVGLKSLDEVKIKEFGNILNRDKYSYRFTEQVTSDSADLVK
jgi:hypothetical protein